MKRRVYFWLGILTFALLIGSYFIKLNLENGGNYIIKTSLLGILIFNNPFILAFYVLIGVILIVKGLNLKIGLEKEL